MPNPTAFAFFGLVVELQTLDEEHGPQMPMISSRLVLLVGLSEGTGGTSLLVDQMSVWSSP